MIDAAARNWSRLGDVAAELGDVSDEAGAKAHAAFKRVQKLCVAAKIAAMEIVRLTLTQRRVYLAQHMSLRLDCV